jgi:hypothetical protein
VREFSKVFWRTENERIFIGETKSESKSRELLQGTGDPEIGSLLTSFGISLSNILSLSSPRWCGVYSPY